MSPPRVTTSTGRGHIVAASRTSCYSRHYENLSFTAGLAIAIEQTLGGKRGLSRAHTFDKAQPPLQLLLNKARVYYKRGKGSGFI